MGPVKALVPIPFAGGIDSKTDPSQVQPGKLIDLQNGVFRQTGAVGRRWGYKALGQSVIGQGTPISACKAVQPFNSELVLFDGQESYSYIAADDEWAAKGSVVSVIQSNQQIIAGNSQQLSPDFGTLGGIEVYAWEDSRGGIRYSIIDAARGTLVVADQPLYAGMKSTARAPKIIPFAAAGVIVVLFDDGYGDIAYVKFNPLNPALVNLGADTLINIPSLISPASSPVYIDAALSSDGLSLHVAAIPTLSPSTESFVYYVAVGATFRPLAGWGGSPIRAIFIGASSVVKPVAIVANGIAMYLLYTSDNGAGLGNGTIVFFASYVVANGSPGITNYPIPIQTGLVNIQSVTGAILNGSAGTLAIFAETPGANTGALAAPQYQRIWVTYVDLHSFIPTAPAILKRSVGLASKPFQYAGNVYLNVAYQSQQQSTYFTIDLNGNVIGKVFSGLCGGLIANSDYTLPECPAISPGVFKYANLIKGFPNTEAGQVLSLLGVNATNLDFFDSNNFLSGTINGSLHTVGGVLQAYDGAAFVELGFHIYPENIVLATAGGGGQSSGVYYYAVTYEWNDNNDRTDISTPSVAASITLTAGQSVNITVPTLQLTKKSRVKIVIYRTQANGQILQRVTSAAVPFYNDPTQDTLTFNDVLSDASIAANGDMYTQPLVLGTNPIVPNSAPPACSLIATYANRLFIGGLDDPYTLWYSQESIADSPMQFSSLLTLRSDPDGGPVTALQRLDDKLIIFKENAIFYLSGQGPTATGDQNDFGVPIAIPSGEVGCASQNSVVVTPVGLLFQSLNGIYLLDRGLNVSYKGAPVEKFNSLMITSATLVPNQWVIFTTTTDIALVYDYYYDQWSTFTNHAASDSALYLGAGNLFVFARPNGQVMMQTPTTFSDNGTQIPFSLTTALFNPSLAGGGLQGFGRIYHAFLLGTYKGDHTLNVACAFDYDPTFVALAAIPVNATLGMTAFGSQGPFGSDAVFGGAAQGASVYQFRVDILRKCQAMQIQITDEQPAPGNEGFALSAISLVIGVKSGGNKVPAIKQFGAS